GAGASPVPEGQLRGLRGTARAQEARQEEVAAARGESGSPTHGSPRARRHRAGGRQRQEAQGSAPRMPAWQQRQRVHRRGSALGEKKRGEKKTTTPIEPLTSPPAWKGMQQQPHKNPQPPPKKHLAARPHPRASLTP